MRIKVNNYIHTFQLGGVCGFCLQIIITTADQRCNTELIIIIHLLLLSRYSTLACIIGVIYYYCDGRPKQQYQDFLNCITTDQIAVPAVQRKIQFIILILTRSKFFHTSKLKCYQFYIIMFTVIKPNDSVFEFALCA